MIVIFFSNIEESLNIELRLLWETTNEENRHMHIIEQNSKRSQYWVKAII